MYLNNKFLQSLTLGIGLLFSHVGVAQEPDWKNYAQILTTVKLGEKHGVPLAIVDYTLLKQKGSVDKVYQQIASYSINSLSNKEEKLAFYINTYNILAIKMLIDHWPVKSIKDIGSFFRPVWGKDAGKIGGKSVSLDDIENNYLRPMGEPRIHLAIVCASVSCPNLSNEPYTGAKINQQLDTQVYAFLHNEQKGLNIKKGNIHISKIFSWFADDFENVGGVNAFIQSYRPDLPSNLAIDADINYDWSVNGFIE